MQLVVPEHRPITPDEWAADERARRADRPWVGVCMVTSLDGATTLDGRSAGLGGPTDTAVLGALRRQADVVLVGAGTVAIEGYGPPKQPGLRIGVVTARGTVDTSRELFRSGAGFLITTERTELAAADDVDVVRAGEDHIDFRRALAALDTVVERPVFVHAEGGPQLNAALVAADLIDELNLTWSPRVVAGMSDRWAAGGAEVTRDERVLTRLAIDDHFVFSRWRRRPSS